MHKAISKYIRNGGSPEGNSVHFTLVYQCHENYGGGRSL
jgi:hypothetical protein